jgi:hypothetical protein
MMLESRITALLHGGPEVFPGLSMEFFRILIGVTRICLPVTVIVMV